MQGDARHARHPSTRESSRRDWAKRWPPTGVASYGQSMGEITVEGFGTPKNLRPRPEGALVDVQGWLHAPQDWDGSQLEHLWNGKHALSRLGVGLCVANSTRRHFLLTNVSEDLELVRTELDSLVAEVNAANARPVSAEPDA